MANIVSVGHLVPPQTAIGHLRPAAIWDFYNVCNCLKIGTGISARGFVRKKIYPYDFIGKRLSVVLKYENIVIYNSTPMIFILVIHKTNIYLEEARVH